MENIILWGTGQISQITEYYINKDKAFSIAAYTMDREYINNKEFNGKKVIPFDEIEKFYPPDEYKMAIPISYKKLNKIREEKYNSAKQKGYKFITYISKDAICDAAKVGENVFIFPFVNIQPFTTIGNNILIWPASAIGHHVEIKDNCFLASPKVSGCVTIEENCFLGTNCTIGDTLKIGKFSIIGAGSYVKKNIKEGTIIAQKQTLKLPVTSYETEDMIL